VHNSLRIIPWRCNGSGGITPASLTLVFDGNKWSAPRSVFFIPGERALGAHWIGGFVDAIAGLDPREGRKLSYTAGGWTPDFQPASHPCTDWAGLNYPTSDWCVWKRATGPSTQLHRLQTMKHNNRYQPRLTWEQLAQAHKHVDGPTYSDCVYDHIKSTSRRGACTVIDYFVLKSFSVQSLMVSYN
jgi:hypothetical protein